MQFTLLLLLKLLPEGLDLTLTTTGNGTCISVSDMVHINITPAPIVNAGWDQTSCETIFCNVNGS